MVKWIAGAVGVSCAVVGGYYGVEALTNYSIPVIPRNTIEKKLKEDGYKIFILEDEKWQAKFDEFKKGDKLTKLKAILQEAKGSEFVVETATENKEGGRELKKWCSEVLDLEIEKVTTNKSIENTKVFCAEKIESTTLAQDTEARSTG